MTKPQKTALNMAKFIQNQSLTLLEKLNELDLDTEADLCEKLHDDAEHLFRTLFSSWMHYRMVTDGQSVY
ncbi:Rop family plasmid primer RNA-binding protein [Klebsiella grimontii]|uniref:Rop family plasmid primer RNA-binding protein n=1 Tax=Klebsiella grimontii TaxID=2058152 RepID=UPI0012B8EA4F|nr:Rop family plasmid primer RNA-binding protein [Klebsiella grimontii]